MDYHAHEKTIGIFKVLEGMIVVLKAQADMHTRVKITCVRMYSIRWTQDTIVHHVRSAIITFAEPRIQDSIVVRENSRIGM